VGLPVAPYVALNRQLYLGAEKAALLARVADLGLPVIVKPSAKAPAWDRARSPKALRWKPRWKKPSAMTTMCWSG